MLDKNTIEFISLIKSKDNTKYKDSDIKDRIKHFITDTYGYDTVYDVVTDNRILIELECVFLEVV